MSSKAIPPTVAWAAVSPLHLLASGAVVFCTYYLSARFQLTHSADYPGLAAVWLPASAGLLALLLFGMRLLPFVGLATGLAYAPLFLVDGYGTLPGDLGLQGWEYLLAAALLAMLQAWVVWQAWQRFVPNDLSSMHDILRFVVMGALLPLLVTTPLLAANLYLGGYLADVPPVIVAGFCGLAGMANALMILLVTLLYLQWRDEGWSGRKDMVAWVAAVGALGVAQLLIVRYRPEFLFLMLPILLLIALTNGSFVASLAALITSMLAIMLGGSGRLLAVPGGGIVYLALLVYLLVLTLASVLGRSRYTKLRRQEEEMSRLVEERTAELRHEVELRTAMAALEEERAQMAARMAEHAAELQAANAQLLGLAKAKDEFLASMSHELRTPLNAILMLTEIMADEMAGPLTPRQRDYLSTIQEGGAHLLHLINDILDLSKLEAGKLEVDPTEVAVADLCSASISLIKGQAAAKNIACELELDPDAALVQADVRRTKQILVNLLGNAVKFTPEHGRVGLHVAGDRTAKVVRFTVWDTGIGIAPENLPRLFAPFVQLDSSLARQYSGTGLGLSLAIRLARLQGGDITVESEVDQGSRFTVTLPWTPLAAAPAAPAQTSKAGQHEQPAREGRILLVDDTPTFLMAARDYLRLRGFDVDTAASGAEALAAIDLRCPDLILLDVQMPGMDGIAFTHRLQAKGQLDTIPIVAVTALAMPGDRERCLAAGMVDYYTKPISLHMLGEIAGQYLPNGKPA